MQIHLNDIKYAIESTSHGREYDHWFRKIAENHNNRIKTYNFLNTNRKCVRFLHEYYGIETLDMGSLLQYVKDDPDILDTHSELFKKLSEIINGTTHQGNKSEDIVIEDLKKFNDIVSIEKVSGERSVKDMKEKIDIVCISSSGEEINIQVKPRGEKITIWDKTSKANFFAFVDGNNNVEYKSNKDIMKYV